MRRRLTALTLLGLLLAVAGPAQAAPPTLYVSVTVAPATTLVGSVAVVSGTVSSHKASLPLLLQRLVSKRWTTIGHGRTTAGGRYAINVRSPKKTATWALRVTRTASLSGSAAVHLRVVKTAFRVRAKAPAGVASGVPVVVTGSVAPKATGSVVLQGLQGSAWHDLVSAKLAKASTFRLTKSLPTGAHRLRVLKSFSTTVANGLSSTITVTVAAPVPPPSAPPGTTPPALAVTTTALPAATQGRTYTTTLAASGGSPPYTWGVQGPLPAGVTLSAAGGLAGFPTATGSSAVTLVVVDAAGASASRTLVLTVGASPDAGRTLRAWGANQYGALGNGTTMNSGTPAQVGTLTGVVATSGSSGTGYGLRDDGTVWAWGYDLFGQLGDGGTTDSLVPVQVPGLSGITDLSATLFGGLALRYDGTVWAWGDGFQGQLGNGTTPTISTVVQVHGITDAVAIAGGGASGYALLSNGTLWAWGEGADGQLGNGKGTLSATPVQVSLPSGITAIAAGGFNAYAVESNGTVWAWGDNQYGQLGDGDGTTTVVLSPVHVSGLTGVKAIAGNLNSAYALLTNGTVWSWGSNSDYQLGDGTTSTQSLVPVQVQGMTDVQAISAGSMTGFARHPDGTVSGWGHDMEGELGDGGTTNSNVPVTVTGLSGAIALGGGTVALVEYAVV